jgi:RCC1 and BTB domain-containing protein
MEHSIVQITCGWSHTVALSSCGKVYTWGNGDHGKLGHGTSDKVAVPKLVDQLAHLRVTKIASYNEHTAALTTGLGMAHGVDFKSVSNEFIMNFKGMVNEEEFSDVTFYVEGRPLYAHRGILSARSQHFRAMFTSGMRESTEKEVRTSRGKERGVGGTAAKSAGAKD